MRAEDRQGIIAALRSGQYRQLKGEEHDGADGFCVMGLVHHLGIEPFERGEALAVAIMNHCTPMTFDEIADKIEAGNIDVSDCPPYGARADSDEHRSRELYALTAGEARLAACLSQGKSVDEAATAMGVTVNTAHAYLRRIFNKTGVRRLTELLRLLERRDDDEPLPPPLPALIYIFPRRPVLSGAIGRPLPDRARARSWVTPEAGGAAWRRLPWRARLVLLLQKAWPGLTRVPLFRRWFVWAAVRLITQVGLAKKARREAGGLPAEVFVESRGDRLIRRAILVVGVTVIIVRHVGYLLLSIGAFALLIPFLLWPPWWPLIRSLFDVARRDEELRQRWEDEAARREIEDDQ